ncbi:putative polyketide synthase [Lophiostoma macrostomum CBS 122681]|uniref:Putative polyketide synthase n=1 Tax=Lophiostoma macrostomum CBS 122681 TaxID=1314788 RepID=A0A6A6SRT7_9PLEO|nr:putative polyketide synthase [Lophiostoma macrostomum CBS 122681]
MGTPAVEPIAIVGFSLGFPQDAVNSEALWEIMMKKRNTATDFPPDRFNADSVYHPDTNRRGQVKHVPPRNPTVSQHNQIPVKRGHFRKDNLAAFDAPFFAISKTDAASMDPQQRWLLEHTYKALENAGLSVESVSGSKTSVYTGSFSSDWMHLAYKDGEESETTTALGVQACFNANRISWFFDLKGNSANVDTACSSSLSIVAGSNVLLSIDNFHTLTNLNMLSLDGQCYSFDHRGNGYGRGEGVGVLILKRVSDAIRNNDTIRGIIRSTGSNQNGHTSSITLPSPASQQILIEETYAKANLSMEPTRFFEAHGTGTIVGDPNESKALGLAFRNVRTAKDPLWVGAIKSNIGHLEGASGIAGVIKAMLVLEKGIIPPNTNFEKLNPKIDADFLNIKFPLEPVPWPGNGLRRASVDSFGNAGTNSHVVLDDVFHFLEEHELKGHHLTVMNSPREPIESGSRQDLHLKMLANIPKYSEEPTRSPKLLVLSAYDKGGVQRQAQAYASYFAQSLLRLDKDYLDNLSFTLSTRRTMLPWKAFAVVESPHDLQSFDKILSQPRKSSVNPGLVFVFTGQGAQWAGMGRELLCVPSFRESIQRSEAFLSEIGCPWSLREELERREQSDIQKPELSQPICTALQIALVDMLAEFNIIPTLVIGHSSGEIAGAYTIGALPVQDALQIAYFRGTFSGVLASRERRGAMLSVGLGSDAVSAYLKRITAQLGNAADLTVACYNSPRNVTVSGDEMQIDTLKILLDRDGVFARKLAVEAAYHSPHMQSIAESYRNAMQEIRHRSSAYPTSTRMISTVNGRSISTEDLGSPDYWVSNMTSPVKFTDAVETLLSRSTQRIRKKLDLSHRNFHRLDMLVEIGPHSALHGPLNEILNSPGRVTKLDYTSVLKRNTSAIDSTFGAMGSIMSLGYPVDLQKLFWSESRLSAEYRTGSRGKLDLLGKPVTDWDPGNPRWRNHLRISEMPWIEDHLIDGTLIYPGAGMLVGVVEAANQITQSSEGVLGFQLKEVKFSRPLVISRDSKGTETQLRFHSLSSSARPLNTWVEFTLSYYEKGVWHLCCRGFVQATYIRRPNEIDNGKEDLEEIGFHTQMNAELTNSASSPLVVAEFYEGLNRDGLGLGPAFHRVKREEIFAEQQGVRCDIDLYQWPEDQFPQAHIIHPTSLDAMFHIAIAGYSEGGRKTIPTVVPTFLRNAFICKSGLSFPQTKDVHAMAWTRSEDDRGIECEGRVLDSQLNNFLVRFDGFRMTKIADNVQNEAAADQTEQLPYCIKYRPDIDLLDDQNQIVPLKASTAVMKRVQKVLRHNGVIHSPETTPYIPSAGKCRDAQSSKGKRPLSNGVFPSFELNVTRSEAIDAEIDEISKDDSKTVSLIVDFSSHVQSLVAEQIQDCLLHEGFGSVHIETLEDAACSDRETDDIFVSLLELDAKFLYGISKRAYKLLHTLLVSAQDVLWVNFAGGTDAEDPAYSVVHGLFRALRNEYENLNLTVLSLEAHERLSDQQMRSFLRVLRSKHVAQHSRIIDVEYLEIEGALCIPRIIPAPHLSLELQRRTSQRRSSLIKIENAPPIRLAIGSPGLLDTLHFVEDLDAKHDLLPHEVEIEAKAFGLNFKDCLAALGQLPKATIGQECAGIVKRSSSPLFEAGDHVIAVKVGGFKSVVRCNAAWTFKIPDTLPFTTAAAIPVQFGTAREVIYRIGHLQPEDSILIHTGASGTGQALIQLALSVGATVFATVSSQMKRDILKETYGLPEEHILYSRDTSFAQGIKRLTNGRGVDVVVNSLSGESLLASWECLAPYGRFIEIGLNDINANSNLPMLKFGSNASFHGFDGSLWMQDRPDLARRTLQEVIDGFITGELHVPKPLHIHDVSDIERALRMLQEGSNAGKFVVEITPDSEVSALVATRPSFSMEPNATFVIAGGLGGIGRVAARWMAERGARNLILLSRSGPRSDAAVALCTELRLKGVRVETPACDVTDLPMMRDVFEHLSTHMPPIKGVCQMSIVARDCLFKDMDFESWSVAVDCKSIGTWNLHAVLPPGMDFFVILSSISGLSGIRGQANYDAGNTYEDAFARYRVSQGEKCIALDLGAMLDDGILAENKELLNRVLAYGTLGAISRQRFYGMLDYYCNPSMPILLPYESQVAIGIGTEDNDSLEGVNFNRQPMLRHATQDALKSGKAGSTGQAITRRELFANASSFEEAAGIVAESIIQKLAKSLTEMQDSASIDHHRQLQMYGVDSLLAVELRNWIAKEFQADIAVFETQGASTLGTLSVSVAARSTIKNGNWNNQ